MQLSQTKLELVLKPVNISVCHAVPPGFCDSAPGEFFAESGKLRRIWKYAQNLAEIDVFGLQTT